MGSNSFQMTLNFTQTYPGYHSKAGQQTNFIEKVWHSFDNQFPFFDVEDKYVFYQGQEMWNVSMLNVSPKIHTMRVIREGKKARWKKGMKIHFKRWTGTPYKSKTFAKVFNLFTYTIQLDQVLACIDLSQ